MCHAPGCVFDLSSTLSSHSSFVSSIVHFMLLNFDFHHFLFHVDVAGAKPLCPSKNEEFGTLANKAPLTSYEPNFFDDYHLSENTATPGPRTCMTLRSVTTPSAERSLHHCSLRSDKNKRAVDKLVTLLKKVCCQLSRCLSVMQERRDFRRSRC